VSFARFYRYDFAVTQIFTDASMASKYYGISISAHLLSYTPICVIQLLNQTKKPFFIDPMTFVFARDIENISGDNGIRRSYKRLMEDYGPPFTICSSGTRLKPTAFQKPDGTIVDTIIAEVCKKVLNYQKTKCQIDTGFAKYAKLLKKKGYSNLQPLSPDFLVAPYFYAERHGDEWYNISLRFAEQARLLKGDARLYPVICISREGLFDKAKVLEIVKDYKGFDGYLIWVSDLNEQELFSSELDGLKALISGLSNYGKPVYSLYGGYLCDLLAKFGLQGYSSGICYGEKRSVDTQGGGAGKRYYIPTVHLKISADLANAFYAVSDKNKRLLCKCPICSKIQADLPPLLSSNEYFDLFFHKMGFLDFRRHFVCVKSQEANTLAAQNPGQIVSSLEKDIAAIQDIDRIPDHPQQLEPRHLMVWRTLFK